MAGTEPALALSIRPFEPQDEAAVVALWHACGLVRPWNDPHKDIARKLTVQPELFLVGLRGGELCAAVMAGYEGHRGWMNYLAVAPSHQRLRIGQALVARVEALLLALGCPKVNLQVRSSNQQVLAFSFYERLGYRQDEAVSLGKRLIADD
ncbi:MAG: Acetyltransferase YpeA [Paracidovorax wautersii]|uniref:Acetyltransferase YpeA n=1 Tax=Paracidovorax wautersii TaxID=1177982 RepID=A0A7V8JP71_9BURK|nr:MAG: Acetyltransferase YpeA [Paracidovorax wautersii]